MVVVEKAQNKWGFLVASSVAVYFDRQNGSSVSDRTSTRLYSFTFLGYTSMMIALVYLWPRHRIISVPETKPTERTCTVLLRPPWNRMGR